MAFLPYDPTRKRSLTGPADDWHAQWGVPPDASGPGGGDVPFQAGAQPPPMPDWSQGRGGPVVGALPWAGEWSPAQTGGYTPLSQLGRGLGRLGGALGLPGFGGGNKPPAPPSQQGAPGPQTVSPGWPHDPASIPGNEMVLLRAPNGQTRQVPGDQVAHYLARGATRG